jgi:hypothetical protein
MSMFCLGLQAQSNGRLRYQALARNSSGVVAAQSISVRISVLNNTLLLWEETHSVITDADGFFVLHIGDGTTTGAGSLTSFDSIPWGGSQFNISVSCDFTGGSSYTFFGKSLLMSVPYSFQSEMSGSAEAVSMSDISDVQLSGLSAGKLLKWDGASWKPQDDNDSDTVNFSSSAAHAVNVDTAVYAASSSGTVDTVLYANTASTASTAGSAASTPEAGSAITSDTATYTTSSIPFNWSINGNSLASSANFLGTTDASALVFKTNNIERSRFTSAGSFGLGTSTPPASFSITGNDGFVSAGTFGSGMLSDSTVGSRMMWYPRKASLRWGTTTSNYWGDSKIGNYSFAGGLNSSAQGIYSLALGINSHAMSENFISIGKDCYGEIIPGDPVGNGATVAMGDSVVMLFTRSIGMGHGIVSTNGGCAFGYRNQISGSPASSVWGSYNNTSGINSVVMGSHGSSNGKNASFLFADASTNAVVSNTVNYQFMVRAAGGTVFYSDAAMTTGVTLFPGGGSWAMTSDKNKKENFILVDGDAVLDGISRLKVCSWSYKGQKRIRHAGPFAQDMFSVFGYGESDKTISSVDINGLTLAGIKALVLKTQKLEEPLIHVQELQSEATKIKSDFNDLDSRLNNIETSLKK